MSRKMASNSAGGATSFRAERSSHPIMLVTVATGFLSRLVNRLRSRNRLPSAAAPAMSRFASISSSRCTSRKYSISSLRMTGPMRSRMNSAMGNPCSAKYIIRTSADRSRYAVCFMWELKSISPHPATKVLLNDTQCSFPANWIIFLFHRRQIGQRAREEPAQEEHDGNVDCELQHSVADQIARLQAKNAQQRQHPEGIHQVRQRFGGVVDLHHPAQVD